MGTTLSLLCFWCGVATLTSGQVVQNDQSSAGGIRYRDTMNGNGGRFARVTLQVQICRHAVSEIFWVRRVVAFKLRDAFWVREKVMTREWSCMTHWRIQPRPSALWWLIALKGCWLCINMRYCLYAPCSLYSLLLISLFDWFGWGLNLHTKLYLFIFFFSGISTPGVTTRKTIWEALTLVDALIDVGGQQTSSYVIIGFPTSGVVWTFQVQ